jgi:hypothetical protein
VHIGHDLPEVAHVDQRATDRAIAEMIGLGLGDAVGIDAAIFSDFYH